MKSTYAALNAILLAATFAGGASAADGEKTANPAVKAAPATEKPDDTAARSATPHHGRHALHHAAKDRTKLAPESERKG